MTQRKILKSSQPSLHGQPQVSFRPNDFNAAIWSHGYDIICETAIRCPCQQHSGAALIDCQNCHGLGYFFINPTRTKALLTGVNRNTQYVQWTPELIGTISISVQYEFKDLISFYNRIIIEDEYANFTELKKVCLMDSVLGVFLTYKPLEIISVWKFINSDSPLQKIDEYKISEENGYVLKVDNVNTFEGEYITVLYKHQVEYHIIDLPHEIRSSLTTNKDTGQFSIVRLPVQSIARRTHLIAQTPLSDGTGIIYNDE